MQEQTGADASPEFEGQAEPMDAETAEVVEEEVSEAPEDQESEAESPTADEEDVEKKTDPFKERIDKLTANWRQTQRDLQAREEEIAQLQERLQSMPEPQEPIKTLADFDYDEGQYQSYLFNRASEAAREEAKRAVEGYRTEQQRKDADSKYRERETAFVEKHKDFHEVVYDRNLRISPAMAEVIRTSDNGPEVAYHLGKNPDIAAELYDMAPARAGFEMAKLASKLEVESKKGGKAVSGAPPPPPKKIGGSEPGRKVSPTSPDSDKLSDDEWFKLEEARKAKMRS